MSESHYFNYHEYYRNPEDHEEHFEVPPQQDDDPVKITLHISKVGGGTIGRRYEGNWAYSVVVDGTERFHGDDFYTGMLHSHRESARVLAQCLADAEYADTDEIGQRLNMFGYEEEISE